MIFHGWMKTWFTFAKNCTTVYKAAASLLAWFILVLTSVFGVNAQYDYGPVQPSIFVESESVIFFNDIYFCENGLLSAINAPIEEPQNSEKKSEENRGKEDKDDEVREQHKSKYYNVFSEKYADSKFNKKDFCVCFHFLNALARKPKRALFLLNHQWKNEIL